MLIAQVELEGVWSVQGGMHELARCMARLATQRGALFHYGQHCKAILVQGGQVTGVELSSGQRLEADSVVFNGDGAALRAGLLGSTVQNAVPSKAPSARCPR